MLNPFNSKFPFLKVNSYANTNNATVIIENRKKTHMRKQDINKIIKDIMCGKITYFLSEFLIWSHEFPEIIKAACSAGSTVKTLVFRESGIKDAHFSEEVIFLLSENTTIKSIDLSDNEITNYTITDLIKILEKNFTITSICINSPYIENSSGLMEEMHNLIVRNNEIQMFHHHFSYYVNALKTINDFIPIDLSSIVLGYFFNATSLDASRYILSNMIPQIVRQASGKEPDIEATNKTLVKPRPDIQKTSKAIEPKEIQIRLDSTDKMDQKEPLIFSKKTTNDHKNSKNTTIAKRSFFNSCTIL